MHSGNHGASAPHRVGYGLGSLPLARDRSAGPAVPSSDDQRRSASAPHARPSAVPTRGVPRAAAAAAAGRRAGRRPPFIQLGAECAARRNAALHAHVTAWHGLRLAVSAARSVSVSGSGARELHRPPQPTRVRRAHRPAHARARRRRATDARRARRERRGHAGGRAPVEAVAAGAHASAGGTKPHARTSLAGPGRGCARGRGRRSRAARRARELERAAGTGTGGCRGCPGGSAARRRRGRGIDRRPDARAARRRVTRRPCHARRHVVCCSALPRVVFRVVAI